MKDRIVSSFYGEFLQFAHLIGSGTFQKTTFELSKKPKPGSIQVFINGKVIPNDAVSTDLKLVRIHPHFTEGEGSKIVITYAPEGGCKSAPSVPIFRDLRKPNKKIG